MQRIIPIHWGTHAHSLCFQLKFRLIRVEQTEQEVIVVPPPTEKGTKYKLMVISLSPLSA